MKDVNNKLKILEDTIKNIPNGIVVCSLEEHGRVGVLFINDFFCKLFGDTKESLIVRINADFNGIIDEEFREAVSDELKNIGIDRPDVTMEWRYTKPDEDKVWISCTLHVGDDALVYGSFSDITEEKNNEFFTRLEEEMHEMTCDFAGAWTWMYDLDTDTCYPGKKLQNQVGIGPVVKMSKKYFYHKAFPEQSRPVMTDAAQRIKRGQSPVEFELQCRYPDGVLHWLRICITRIEMGLYKGNYVVGSAKPIDMERALREKIELEKQKVLVHDRSLRAYIVTNISRNRVLEHAELMNKLAIEIDGMKMEEALETVLPSFADEEDRKKYSDLHNRESLLEAYAKGKTTREMEARRKMPNGEIIWARSVLNLLKEPVTEDILLYEYCYDIHARKMFEKVMGEAVNFIYERTGGLNLKTGQISLILPSVDMEKPEVFNADYEELIEKYAEDFVYAEDKETYLQMASAANIIEQCKVENHFEFIHRTLEDNQIRYKRNLWYLYDRKEMICLALRTDMTETIGNENKKRKELTEALAAAEQATLAKSEFLSRMSHEIRTPMNAIMGMTAIAQENKADFQQVSECLEKIDMSSHYLLTLINDILEMSRIESGKTEIGRGEFDFNFLMEGIQTIVETLALKSNIRYEYVNHTSAESHYYGDMIRIQQVLVNIISNAIKFTKPGGRVRFLVEILEETKAKTIFRFSVADTGIGMSNAFMKKMFRPFEQEDSTTTSRYEGSGLGLAISKSLIEAMGGQIEVDSFVGIGSTFRVILPLERIQGITSETVYVEPEMARGDESILKGSRILMAEDHPLNVMIAKKLLERKGAIVTVADNGQMAVDIFNKAEPGFYQAILMDIRMPVMDGLEAAKRIRGLERTDAKNIPIIAMTANALDEDRRKSKDAGMNEHLAKPFEPAQLYTILSAAMVGQGERTHE